MPQPQTGISKADLIAAMNGHEATNNWDVMCCYRETELNSLLQQKYSQGKLVADITFKAVYHDPLFDQDITIDVDLKLREPQLSFEFNTRSTCKLTMPILGGTYTMSSSDGKTIKYDIPPDVLQVICTVPLGAMSGDTQEVHDGTKPIIFDNASPVTQHICLHFKNTDMTVFDVIPMAGKDDKAKTIPLYNENVQPVIIEQIKYFFQTQVSEIDYAVGSLSNTTKPGVLTVTPKSFIFVQCKPNENADGSLNLYIQTDNSKNPQGDLTPSFQPGGTAIPSIPDGYSASLILSNDFMQNSFFTSQLNKDGWTTVPQATAQGIVYHLTKNEKIHVPGVSQMGRDQQHSDDVNIDFNTTP